jgi:hypothetical protein
MLWIAFSIVCIIIIIISSSSSSVFLLHIMYRKIHKQNFTYKCMYTYSFFIVYIVFNAACIQTKYCWSCLHRVKLWAGLT